MNEKEKRAEKFNGKEKKVPPDGIASMCVKHDTFCTIDIPVTARNAS